MYKKQLHFCKVTAKQKQIEHISALILLQGKMDSEKRKGSRPRRMTTRQFKRLLKTHLFGVWDRGALWRLS